MHAEESLPTRYAGTTGGYLGRPRYVRVPHAVLGGATFSEPLGSEGCERDRQVSIAVEGWSARAPRHLSRDLPVSPRTHVVESGKNTSSATSRRSRSPSFGRVKKCRQGACRGEPTGRRVGVQRIDGRGVAQGVVRRAEPLGERCAYNGNPPTRQASVVTLRFRVVSLLRKGWRM